ncbi:serine hydrolase [Blastococcus brunescens]|uniref:Serine hydrolase n=1 Tax=Blastococcus brunescens TaxID=1564165 RepID=A0ABZ1B3R9_9ACTN|nr:serine hydrolase [Blastococcus sp. BMG 8361]WRL65452.1 serine hydrolase [Blastococcus sp. BMG 8361]
MALVLVAESGLLVGLVLPGSSLVIGLGVLAGAGLVSVPVVALTATAATVAGAALGHRCGSRVRSAPLLPTGGRFGRLLPERVRHLVERSASPWTAAVAGRPARMAALAQLITGSRTLAPRIAARTGVPLPTMLRGTVPAALLWSWGLVGMGAAAGAAVPVLRDTVALAGLPLVIAATWLLLRRRERPAVATGDRAAARRGPLRRGWPLTLAGSTGVASMAAVLVLGCCVTDADADDGHPAASSSPTTGAVSPSAAPASATPSIDQDQVLGEVEAAATAAGGSIRVVVLDADGQPLLTGPDADTSAYTASLVKILVVARLLGLNAAGSLSLSGDDLNLMELAVAQSDDDAMNTLWARYDGAQLVRDIAASARLVGTSPPVSPGRWGQTLTTATDIAAFLAAVEDILDPADAATLFRWMRSATATAADGFDQRFGLLADGSGAAAAKQGWMCCPDGRRQLHSAGILEDGRVVVLLGDFPASTTWPQAAAALDTAADAARTGTDADADADD